MRSTSLLLFLIAASFTLLAQKTSEVPEVVYALKFHEGQTKQLTTKYEAFQVEKGDIISVRKGWEIFIDKQAKAFVFRKAGTSTTVKTSATLQFAEIKDDYFRSFCYCPPDANGNCKFTTESIGQDDIVRCEGNCPCNSFHIFEPPTSPREVLHPSMGWQEFPLW